MINIWLIRRKTWREVEWRVMEGSCFKYFFSFLSPSNLSHIFSHVFFIAYKKESCLIFLGHRNFCCFFLSYIPFLFFHNSLSLYPTSFLPISKLLKTLLKRERIIIIIGPHYVSLILWWYFHKLLKLSLSLSLSPPLFNFPFSSSPSFLHFSYPWWMWGHTQRQLTKG